MSIETGEILFEHGIQLQLGSPRIEVIHICYIRSRKKNVGFPLTRPTDRHWIFLSVNEVYPPQKSFSSLFHFFVRKVFEELNRDKNQILAFPVFPLVVSKKGETFFGECMQSYFP